MSAWTHGCVLLSPEHKEEFYAEFRRRRDAAIARGEDPYAEYKAKVAQRQRPSVLAKARMSVVHRLQERRNKRYIAIGIANDMNGSEYERLVS